MLPNSEEEFSIGLQNNSVLLYLPIQSRMKTTLFLFTGLLIFLSVNSISAQCFKEKDMIFDGKYELGYYGTQNHDKIKNVTTNSQAASKIFNLSVEYAITKWVGIGAKFQYDNFFTGKDTVRDLPNPKDYEVVKPTVNGYDFAAFANGHFVKKKSVDMYAGISFGYSSILYKRNSVDNAQASGSGTWLDIHLSPRFYFGEHFGMNVNLAYSTFNYTDLKVQNNSVQPLDAFGLKGSGVNLGVGLMYKISTK
jgi:hypothetical protein